LLEPTARGSFKITERGLSLLEQGLKSLSIKDLKRYPDFKKFHEGKKSDKQVTSTQRGADDEETPEDTVLRGYQIMRRELAEEILSVLKGCTPAFFERVVVDLLVRMGYGGSVEDAGEAVGRVGDGGIDGVIKEDKLGLDFIYLQAKRWEGTVHSPEIRNFVGALAGRKAKKGVFIATSSFSKGARDFARGLESKIVLIDGEQLAELMIDHGVGVSVIAAYEVKKIDTDYFEE
jgi:restriction system protein